MSVSVSKKSYTIAELTRGLDVEIKGDAHCVISGIATIQHAKIGDLTFLSNSIYRKFLAVTQASAVILSPNDGEKCSTNAIVSKNPYYAYAKIAEHFYHKPRPTAGIHPSAIIGQAVEIDSSVAIGPHCYIGDHVKIGSGAIIAANTVIGDHVEIGDEAQIDPNVTIYARVKIGKRTHIGSGAVIGGDGFGFALENKVWHKVPQLGGVIIGDDVVIGPNTTVDCGAMEDTIIENGAKLDNLIQIGHNVRIGENTIMAGMTGVAGSAVIGKNCMIGGASRIAGHITICDNAMITATTGVSKSLHEPGIYSSGIVGVVSNHEFRKNNARFHRLENLMQRVKALEATMNKNDKSS